MKSKLIKRAALFVGCISHEGEKSSEDSRFPHTALGARCRGQAVLPVHCDTVHFSGLESPLKVFCLPSLTGAPLAPSTWDKATLLDITAHVGQGGEAAAIPPAASLSQFSTFYGG